MSYTIIKITFILTLTFLGRLNVHRKLDGPNEVQSGASDTNCTVDHRVVSLSGDAHGCIIVVKLKACLCCSSLQDGSQKCVPSDDFECEEVRSPKHTSSPGAIALGRH